MKQTKNKYHKKLAAVIIILSLSAAVILCHITKVLDYVEFKLYDLRINMLSGNSRRSDDIILIFLDQNSLDWAQEEKGWGWPWPRKAYGDFLDYMNLGGAKAVVFDVLFSEPSIYRNSRQDDILDDALESLAAARTAVSEGRGMPVAGRLFMEAVNNLQYLRAGEDDASFAAAEKRYGKMVQTVFFNTEQGSATTWPDGLDVPLFNPQNFGENINMFSISGEDSWTGAQFTIEELRNAAAAIGNVSGNPDSDDVFRRNRLFTLFDGKAVPGLAAASLLVSGYTETISYDEADKSLKWGEYTIPVDDEGKTLLRYRGPIEDYPWYSLHQVLQSAEDHAAGRTPLLEPENFRDAYVFFGLYAPGLYDIFQTPVSASYPGMGAHITMLDNLLMGDFIKQAPAWAAILLIFAATILVVSFFLFSGRIVFSVAGFIATLAAISAAGIISFQSGYWIPVAAPLIAAMLAFLTSTLYNYATEGKDKRYIKNAFSRIISPKVVDILIADPSQLKLGGEKRKMTAIFTDIQRFSSISSELQDAYGEDGPKVLVNLLNLYLTEMSDIVLANGGTIDKYEGDAIIAFFGAPVWMENHAALACKSAIQMKKRELELVKSVMVPEGEFYSPLAKLIGDNVIRRKRPLYTRLGVNTGDMVVGFMGTPSKMDYTIMGNAVNLAARLEGVNKQYDTKGILISEYTRGQIGDEFVTRPLSRVTVVGIPVPLRLFELLDVKSEAAPETFEMVKQWDIAFRAYEARDFLKAKELFAGIFRKDPEDNAARLYMERCEKFAASPPPPAWDGVDNLTEK